MPSPSLSRRTLMRHLAAGCGLAAIGGVPGAALATTPSNRRFVFVTAFGGWDPTRVFAPMFDSPHVSMEPDAERVQQEYKPSVSLSWRPASEQPRVAQTSCDNTWKPGPPALQQLSSDAVQEFLHHFKLCQALFVDRR